MKDSMVFYRSFFEAINNLPDENQLTIYKAIFEFGFNETETELNGTDKLVFTLIKPQLEANNRKAKIGKENGHKGAEFGHLGGRPPKENNPQKTLKKPSNVNDNVNNNKNSNVNVNAKKGGISASCIDYVDWFNKLYNTKYKPNKELDKNLKHWLETYTINEIKNALWYASKIASFEAEICRTEPIKLLRTKNANGNVDYIGLLLNSKKPTYTDIQIKHCRQDMNEATRRHLIEKHNLATDFFEWPLIDKLTELTIKKLTPTFEPLS